MSWRTPQREEQAQEFQYRSQILRPRQEESLRSTASCQNVTKFNRNTSRGMPYEGIMLTNDSTI